MKYIKVRVRRHPNGVSWARKHGFPTMVYPDGYGDIEFEHSGYVKEDGVTYVLGALKNDASGLDRVLKSDDVVELTKEEAVAFSEKNQQRTEKITDEAKIRRLEIKSRFGKRLTSDEEKALDPDDPTPGIQKNEILADKFNKHT